MARRAGQGKMAAIGRVDRLQGGDRTRPGLNSLGELDVAVDDVRDAALEEAHVRDSDSVVR